MLENYIAMTFKQRDHFNQARRISILGGRLIDPANQIDQQLDLHLSHGEILAVGDPPEDFEPKITIDATGQIVCPGLIDLCARLREPGQEYKATIASETAAAASAGITTLCCPPDTNPVIDTPSVIELIRRQAKRSGKARILPIGALTRRLRGEQLSEMAALKDAGCLFVSNGLAAFANTQVQRCAMEYAASFDLICILFPEDSALRNQGCVHEGKIATQLGLPGIPAVAETVALAKDLALAEQTQARVHFHALSTSAGVQMLAAAQQHLTGITADVGAHQLHLTEEAVMGFHSHCHVRPPLRTHADRNALRQALAKGQITAICSDHQPHEPDAKNAPFPATEPGLSGLETLLPLTLRLVDEKVLSLSEAIACLTSRPAQVLGQPLGQLSQGASADICIFDPEIQWQLQADQMQSQGYNSPFLGWTFRGQVIHTLFKGRIVFSQQQERLS